MSPLATLAALLLFIPADALAHGAYHELAAELTDQLERDPLDNAARLRLADAHLEHEEWTSCLAELETLASAGVTPHQTAPTRGAALLGLGQPAKAIAALDAYLETADAAKSPAQAASARTIRARCHVAMGDHGTASNDFAAALSARLGSPALHGEYADSLVSAGRKPEALDALNRAMKTHRGDPEVMERAWRIQADLGQWEAARKTADALAAAAPASEPWLARHARLLMRSGKTEEASKAWVALRDHLLSLPSLQRGTPQNRALLTESGAALGQPAPAPVLSAPR